MVRGIAGTTRRPDGRNQQFEQRVPADVGSARFQRPVFGIGGLLPGFRFGLAGVRRLTG